MQNSAGDIILLEAAMEGMNAVPDPEDPEERKGCSGHISKLIISEVRSVHWSPYDRVRVVNADP
jgi:hypothetical protein